MSVSKRGEGRERRHVDETAASARRRKQPLQMAGFETTRRIADPPRATTCRRSQHAQKIFENSIVRADPLPRSNERAPIEASWAASRMWTHLPTSALERARPH